MPDINGQKTDAVFPGAIMIFRQSCFRQQIKLSGPASYL